MSYKSEREYIKSLE